MFKLLTAFIVISGITLPNRYPTQIEYDVESAARNYRIQVYNTFRLNRAEYDRRQAKGREVLDAWKESGRNKAQSQELIEWFSEASEASRVVNGQGLPSLPQFAHATENQIVSIQPDQRGTQLDQRGTPPDQRSTQQTDAPETGAVEEVGRALFNAFRTGGSPTDTAPESRTTPPTGEPIDVDALKAQVDEYNVSIFAIDQGLADTAPIGVEKLTQFVDQVEQLVQVQHQLEPLLAQANLSDPDRVYVGQLTAFADTISALTERANEVRVQLEGANQDLAELEQLDTLLERLETISSQL